MRNMNFIRYKWGKQRYQRGKWTLELWKESCPLFPYFIHFTVLFRSLMFSLLLHPFFLHFPPQKPHASSRSLIRCSTCSLFVLRPWHVVSFPCSEDSPGVLGIMEWNAGVINPGGCLEKTQECVNQGDNTLFSCASVGGAGIMVLQAGFADLQPPSAGWDVYSGRYHRCHGGHQRNILTSVLHKGLH